MHDRYPIEVMRTLPTPSAEWLSGAMAEAEPSLTFYKWLMRLLPLGREVSDHCLLAAGIEPSTKLSTEPWSDGALVERLLQAITSTTHYFHQAIPARPMCATAWRVHAGRLTD